MNKKVYEKIIEGRSDNNIDFNDFKNLLIALGFVLDRQRGSHMIYRHCVTGARLNVQPKGNKAKAYQVAELRALLLGGQYEV